MPVLVKVDIYICAHFVSFSRGLPQHTQKKKPDMKLRKFYTFFPSVLLVSFVLSP